MRDLGTADETLVLLAALIPHLLHHLRLGRGHLGLPVLWRSSSLVHQAVLVQAQLMARLHVLPYVEQPPNHVCVANLAGVVAVHFSLLAVGCVVLLHAHTVDLLDVPVV